MKLAFGPYLPDLPNHGSTGVSEVLNLYPGSVGFRPVGQWVSHSDALPSACRGAAAFIAPSGRLSIIAGTKSALYRQDGLGWTQIGTGYNLGASSRWRFIQFGAIAIATNTVDPMVKINLETDAVSLLAGSPPKFESLAVINNFVVGTKSNGAVNTIAWSGENNAEWWTPAQRKSDFQELPDGGEITGIVGGEVGLILQRNAVRRMAYVGGNVLFRFDKISTNVGCASPHTVAQHGELAFWHSHTGFKMWDGAQIRSIGFEKVDNAFSGLYGQVKYEDMSTAIDAQKSTVCWSTGYYMWIYNWLLDQWSVIEFDSQIITQRQTPAPGLEEQDPIVGQPDDNVDGANLIPFDSGRFIGGDPAFYVFNSEGALGTFSGENMGAQIKGRQVEMAEGRDVKIRKVRPMSDVTSGVTLQIDTRQRLGDAARRRDFTTLQASGNMPVRARGRFATTKLSIAEGEVWTYLQGVDATVSAGARR